MVDEQARAEARAAREAVQAMANDVHRFMDGMDRVVNLTVRIVRQARDIAALGIVMMLVSIAFVVFWGV